MPPRHMCVRRPGRATPRLPSPPPRAGGALEDLLPALAEGEEAGDALLPSHLMPTSGGGGAGTAMPPTVPSALLAGPTSQFPLFTETGGATQPSAGLPKESINRATMTVLQVGWPGRAAGARLHATSSAARGR